MVQVVRQQGPMGNVSGCSPVCSRWAWSSAPAPVPGGGASPAAGGTDAPSSAAPSTSTTTTPAIPAGHPHSSVATDAKIPVDTVVSVAAKDGTVTDVTLTYKDPKKGEVNVEGNLDPNGATGRRPASWSRDHLHLSMVGKNTAGTESTTHSTFSTQALSKKQQIYPRSSPTAAPSASPCRSSSGSTCPVKDKAAFEKKMTVKSVPAAGGLVGLDLQQRGALAAGELLEAGHQGLRQRRHQQRPRRQRHLRPSFHLRVPSPSATRRSSRADNSRPTR